MTQRKPDMKSTAPIPAATIPRFSDGQAKDPSRDQIRFVSPPAHQAMARAYLRDLRAAEMLGWEMTGGDYLISEAARKK